MPQVGLKELLQAGTHFGHQTRRWNPSMRRFIHGEQDGIHIIDLLQTVELLEEARQFVGQLATGGGTILFVGTKKQARDSIRDWATRSNMPYVNQRWLGGLLTNYQTISARIARLHHLTQLQQDGQLDLLPTKERMGMQAELTKLEYNLGGVRDMQRLPDAVFVIDLKTEEIAVKEAVRLRIPVIGVVDTNCDPSMIDYVIPGNDDAIRSCELFISTLGSAIETGANSWRTEEERRRTEEEERRRRDEEERRKREAEDKARVEAEAQAQAAAASGEQATPAPAEAAAQAAAPAAEAVQTAPAEAAPAEAPAEATQADPAESAEAPAAEAAEAAEAPAADAPAEAEAAAPVEAPETEAQPEAEAATEATEGDSK